MTGTDLTTSLPVLGVPPEIMSACLPWDEKGQYFASMPALAALRDRGMEAQIPGAAAAAKASLARVDHNRLTDRLTALGMMLAPNRPPAEATVWLNEMARLLGDLPEDLLGAAIDEHVRTSKFLPTCAEIRALADPEMKRRRTVSAHLDSMARLLASGEPIPRTPAPPPPKPIEPEKPMTEAEVEEMNRILANVGAATRYRPDGTRYEVETAAERRAAPRPLRKPTRQDYIDLGVDPAVLDTIGADIAA